MLPVNPVINEDGFMRVYDIPKRQWVRRAPVDVREYLKAGTGSLQGPCVAVERNGEQETICKEQVVEYRANGWSVKPTAPETANDADEEQIERPRERANSRVKYDFDQHNVPQLRALAQHAGIERIDSMKRTALVAALTESGFVPTEAQIDDLAR